MGKLENTVVGGSVILFVMFWIVSVLLSLAGTGLVLYILWRVATHPW